MFILFISSKKRKLKLEHYFTPAKQSMKRRELFDSREEALGYFSSKSLFKNVPKATIELYVKYGLVKDQEQVSTYNT